MPKIAVKIQGSTVAEMSPIVESTIPSAIPMGAGFVSGLVLGSCANLAGLMAGTIVTEVTRIPKKITCLAGSVACGAYLVHYLGNSSPFSLGLKAGAVFATVFWPTRIGSGDPAEGISEDKRLGWQRNGHLAGLTIAAGCAYLGNPVLGAVVGGIAGNLIAKIGREPEAAPVVRNPAIEQDPHEA